MGKRQKGTKYFYALHTFDNPLVYFFCPVRNSCIIVMSLYLVDQKIAHSYGYIGRDVMCRTALRYFSVFLIIAFVSGCEGPRGLKGDAGPPGKLAPPVTPVVKSPSIITAAREYIRIRHENSNADAANEMAIKWCQDQNLSAQKTNSRCSESCITVYQCR
jgi:hypothetical protein